ARIAHNPDPPHPHYPGGRGAREPAPVRTVVLPHMTCLQFRDRYSDYRDGLITSERELRQFQRHFTYCAACRRYDAAVRRGVLALQAARHAIAPSPEFRRRLESRLARERPGEPELPARAGLAAALLLAALLGLLALEGTRRCGRSPLAPWRPPPAISTSTRAAPQTSTRRRCARSWTLRRCSPRLAWSCCAASSRCAGAPRHARSCCATSPPRTPPRCSS